MSPTETACEIGPQERVSLLDPRLRDCLFQPGTRITIYYDPLRDQPPRKGAPKMREGRQVETVPDSLPPLPVAPHEPQLPATPAPTVASVGMPSTAAGELARLIPANGEIGLPTLLLALIAVLGGGATWRYLSLRSKQQHELAMRELEIKAAQAQPNECKAEHVAVREALSGLDERCDSLDHQRHDLTDRVALLEERSGQEAPEGLDDLQTRVSRLERVAKAAGKAAPRRDKPAK